jgi:hypothetical protein
MRPRGGNRNLACHAGTFWTAAGNSCRDFVAAASSRLRRLGPRPPAGTRWQAAGATHGRLQGEERRTHGQQGKKQARADFAPWLPAGLRPPVATSMDGVTIAYHMAYDPDANDGQNYDVEHVTNIGRRGSFTTGGPGGIPRRPTMLGKDAGARGAKLRGSV